MFVICKETGSYSDYSKEIVLVCSRQKEAEEAVSLLNSINKKHSLTQKDIYARAEQYSSPLKEKVMDIKEFKKTYDKSLNNLQEDFNSYLSKTTLHNNGIFHSSYQVAEKECVKEFIQSLTKEEENILTYFSEKFHSSYEENPYVYEEVICYP